MLPSIKALIYKSVEDQAMTESFVGYVETYGKSYGTKAEFEFRQDLYAKKDKIIEEWNSRSNVTHLLGHNQFSDWTELEFKRVLGYAGPKQVDESKVVILDENDLPESVNWVEKGAVNPPQDQGQCGSCWAFSAIASMEGAHFLKAGKLLKLSEQQCVDCDTESYGCKGGW